MPLTNDLATLRDRTLVDLNTAHDYYLDTKTAWRIARQAILASTPFTYRNRITGTVTTQQALAARAVEYIAKQLVETTFQQFLSIFESFFFDLLRLWLLAYPQSLSRKPVDFKTILDAPDKDAIILLVVNKELNEILYERPTRWFAYLEERAKLGCPTGNEIERFAEAKASRDVLVHNRGVVSKAYVSKAGRLARFKEGDRIDLPEDYHQATWELIRKIVTDICATAIAKAR